MLKIYKIRHIAVATLLSISVSVCAQQRYAMYDAYVDQYKDLAIEQMREHSIPASITLAQGILESGAGKSTLAVRANNHFGIKCHTDWEGARFYKDDDARNECFRVYKNVRQSYEDHSQFLKKSRYARLYTYDILDYKSWAKGLKACGYATSPTYAEKLIKIIETYELYRFDRGESGSRRQDDGRRQDRNRDASTTAAARYGHQHQSYIVNGVVCYRAQAGDTWDILAEELGVKKKKLLKYNECEDTFTQLNGMNIFVGKKKAKADKKSPSQWHRIRHGESMYSISQTYGIKVSKLYKMNFKSADFVPTEGDILKIR